MRTVGLLVLLLTAGCQDHTTGIQTLCNAPRDCVKCQSAEIAMHDQLMAEHIQRSVRNEDALALFEALATVSDGERAKRLEKAAKEAGLSGCILADRFKARQEAWDAHKKSQGAAPP